MAQFSELQEKLGGIIPRVPRGRGRYGALWLHHVPYHGLRGMEALQLTLNHAGKVETRLIYSQPNGRALIARLEVCLPTGCWQFGRSGLFWTSSPQGEEGDHAASWNEKGELERIKAAEEWFLAEQLSARRGVVLPPKLKIPTAVDAVQEFGKQKIPRQLDVENLVRELIEKSAYPEFLAINWV
jgi:hypothetical protein